MIIINLKFFKIIKLLDSIFGHFILSENAQPLSNPRIVRLSRSISHYSIKLALTLLPSTIRSIDMPKVH